MSVQLILSLLTGAAGGFSTGSTQSVFVSFSEFSGLMNQADIDIKDCNFPMSHLLFIILSNQHNNLAATWLIAPTSTFPCGFFVYELNDISISDCIQWRSRKGPIGGREAERDRMRDLAE